MAGAPGSADTQYTFDAAPGAEGCSGLIEQPKREAGATVGFYQVIAPLTAMLKVRNTSQLANNDTALALLQRAWERRGVTIAPTASCFPQTQGARERIRPFLEGTTAAP